MNTSRKNNITAQMRKGVLEYCILTILGQQDCYAPDIIKRLKDVQLIVVEGTLYPLLTRQKNAGLLSYRWEESPQGPPRKYYRLTDQGRSFLEELDISWENLVKAVASIHKSPKNRADEKDN